MNSSELGEFIKLKLAKDITSYQIQRDRRSYAETTPEKLIKVAQALKDAGMVNIGTITGLDSGENFEVIYHFYNQYGLVFNLKVFTPRKDPKIPSVTDVYPSVYLYERELMDLLGIQVEGIPPGRHYPLPEGWPEGQYPLRKDWKGLPGEGVTTDG
jgi:membrane-bound hydrogenase subunit beta